MAQFYDVTPAHAGLFRKGKDKIDAGPLLEGHVPDGQCILIVCLILT